MCGHWTQVRGLVTAEKMGRYEIRGKNYDDVFTSKMFINMHYYSYLYYYLLKKDENLNKYLLLGDKLSISSIGCG